MLIVQYPTQFSGPPKNISNTFSAPLCTNDCTVIQVIEPQLHCIPYYCTLNNFRIPYLLYGRRSVYSTSYVCRRVRMQTCMCVEVCVCRSTLWLFLFFAILILASFNFCLLQILFFISDPVKAWMTMNTKSGDKWILEFKNSRTTSIYLSEHQRLIFF